MRCFVLQGSVGIDWEQNTMEEYDALSMTTIETSLKLPKDRLMTISRVKPDTPAATVPGLSQWSILRTVNGASVDGVDFDDVIDLLVAERSEDMPLVIDVLERTEHHPSAAVLDGDEVTIEAKEDGLCVVQDKQDSLTVGFDEMASWEALLDGLQVTMADKTTMLFKGADAVELDRLMHGLKTLWDKDAPVRQKAAEEASKRASAEAAAVEKAAAEEAAAEKAAVEKEVAEEAAAEKAAQQEAQQFSEDIATDAKNNTDSTAANKSKAMVAKEPYYLLRCSFHAAVRNARSTSAFVFWPRAAYRLTTWCRCAGKHWNRLGGELNR
jgi:hypothetical protein